MATVRILRSTTTGNTPASLVSGQIAINEADGKLFYRNGSGVVTQLATGGGGGGTELYSFATTASFPATGVTTALYLAIDSGRVYQWTGSVYAEVGPVGGGGSLSATVTIPASGDQYWTETQLLLRGDAALDSSLYERSVTANAGAAISTSHKKFGTGSLSFASEGDHYSIPASPDLSFGTGDFTAEAWIRPTSYPANNADNYISTFLGRQTPGYHCWRFDLYGTSSSLTTLAFTGMSDSASGIQTVTAPYSFALNTWYHVAASRVGGVMYLFVNGVLQNSGGSSFSISIQDQPTSVRVGALMFDSTYKYQFFGQIDDVRITKGAGRYTATFTPPTATYGTGIYTAAQTLPVVFSDAAPAITISSQPTNQTAASGAATFGVTATVSPSGTATYQWERSDDGGSTFTAVSGATSATLALTGLTNASDDNDRYRVVVGAVGAASVTSNAVTLTVAASTPPLSLAGTRPSNLASGTTSNGYTLTGTGTSASPSVLRIGGGNNNDYRVWLIVNQTGTLNWTVTASSEDGYDGGRLYSAGAPANYTPGGFNDATPAGYTAVSNWLSGSQTQTGTTSVTAGQHIVLRWARDDGGDGGNNRIELSAYMS